MNNTTRHAMFSKTILDTTSRHVITQAISTAMFFGLGGLLMAHLSACLWYTLGMHPGVGKVGWIARYDPKGEWGAGDCCALLVVEQGSSLPPFHPFAADLPDSVSRTLAQTLSRFTGASPR